MCIKILLKTIYSSCLPKPTLTLFSWNADRDITENKVRRSLQIMFCNWVLCNFVNWFMNRNIVQNLTSETNLKNLDQLKHYKYSQIFRKNPKNGKVVIVYICGYPNCGKEFMRTWNLLDHVRMHVGVKPYACHICGKSFTQIGNMRKHVQQHLSTSNQQNSLQYEGEMVSQREGMSGRVSIIICIFRVLTIICKFSNNSNKMYQHFVFTYRFHTYYLIENN